MPVCAARHRPLIRGGNARIEPGAQPIQPPDRNRLAQQRIAVVVELFTVRHGQDPVIYASRRKQVEVEEASPFFNA